MRIIARLFASFAVAAGTPWLQVQIACREPASEACVWGKAYLPLSTTISTIMFTPLVFVVLWAIETGIRRRRDRPDGRAYTDRRMCDPDR